MKDFLPSQLGGVPEFVGTTVLDTIGLVIPNVDYQLRQSVEHLKNYRSIGILSSRCGAAGQINAIDEAIKRTNTEILSIQLPRDTKGGAGHGNYIVIGAANEADAREAIKIALEYTEYYSGELYVSDAGHLEMTCTANAGPAIQYFFNAPAGQAFGFMAGAPAAVGMVMADACLKAADVEMLRYLDAANGTSFTNEVIVAFTGDAEAVENSIKAARHVGLTLLSKLGKEAKPVGKPYLI